MHLAWYGRKLSAQKNANWGVGVILSQIAMVTMIMIVAYIWNFFSIRYYLVHILAKYWAFIAYIKRISTLQTFGHSQNWC